MTTEMEFDDILMVTEHLIGEILVEIQTGGKHHESEHFLQRLAEVRALLKVYRMSRNEQDVLFTTNREGVDDHPF